jgi:2-hydroxy-3-keto-5-methylthiopentenyl-1-phosphate phosphatase
MNAMKNGRTLALFDFDGTITKKDTFILIFSCLFTVMGKYGYSLVKDSSVYNSVLSENVLRVES